MCKYIIVIIIIIIVLLIASYTTGVKFSFGNINYAAIDQVLYINLKDREDRKTALLEEFKRIDMPFNKITRIDAIKDKFGAYGCTLSHIKALEYAKQMNYKTVLICEDDLNFTYGNQLTQFYIGMTRLMKFDVVMLSGTIVEVEKYNDIFDRATKVMNGSCYLVNYTYYDTLINNLKEGAKYLKKYGHNKGFNLDVYWFNLQQKDKWYIFKNRLGYQRPSYSDIEYKHVDYPK